MKVNYIHLDHFRCFTDLKLSPAPSVNVITGDNSSGKTTLIEAIRCVLSSFFVGFSDDNTKFIGLSDSDFTEQISSSGEELLMDKPIVVNYTLDDIDSALIKNSRKNSKTLTSGIKELTEYTKNLYNNLFEENQRIIALPLFAYFSTRDVVPRIPRFAFSVTGTKGVSEADKFKEYLHKPSFGYYECLNGQPLFFNWISRLLVLQEANKAEEELEGVKRAIVDALGENGCNIINGIDIRPNKKSVYFLFTDGREIDHRHLSDGYDRLVNIVMDVAFRAMLLNKGISGVEACKKTEGTVLIDEIDLHLHPELQVNVLKGLKNAFPKLQFVVSTHAPLVMSGVQADENNKLFKFSYSKENGYECDEKDVYGMDASTILTTIMDAPEREPSVEEKLNKLFSLIDDELFSDAEKMLKELEDYNLPELAKARTMIEMLK